MFRDQGLGKAECALSYLNTPLKNPDDEWPPNLFHRCYHTDRCSTGVVSSLRWAKPVNKLRPRSGYINSHDTRHSDRLAKMTCLASYRPPHRAYDTDLGILRLSHRYTHPGLAALHNGTNRNSPLVRVLVQTPHLDQVPAPKH